MTHQKYLSIIGLAGLLSWTGWFVVVWKLAPMESTNLALSFFFIMLFLALSCTFAIFGFYIRLWLNSNEVYYHHINISLRQGVLLSLLTQVALALQLVGVLTWWTGMLLILSIVLIELYFAISQK